MPSEFQRLRVVYDDAYGEWAMQVRTFLVLSSTSDSRKTEIRDAREHAAAAEFSYRESRDALAELILAPAGCTPAPVPPPTGPAAPAASGRGRART